MSWIPSIMFNFSHTIKYIYYFNYCNNLLWKEEIQRPFTLIFWYKSLTRPILPKLANSRKLLNGYSIALYPPSTHPYILKSKYKIHDSTVKIWVFQRGLSQSSIHFFLKDKNEKKNEFIFYSVEILTWIYYIQILPIGEILKLENISITREPLIPYSVNLNEI